MKEKIEPLNTNLKLQIEAIHGSTGLNIEHPNLNYLYGLPLKAIWQVLMVQYWLKTGKRIGDPTTQLMSPKNTIGIRNRVDVIRNTGQEAWASTATKRDALNWAGEHNSAAHWLTLNDTGRQHRNGQQHRGIKPPLWKDIGGTSAKATNWEVFVAELAQAQQLDPQLILKIFPQGDYLITNIRMEAGSKLKKTDGWSINVEWLETTSSRDGDEKIPRSFAIVSQPTLSIICDESTRASVLKFLTTSLPQIKEIISFWESIDCPPAVLECMRLAKTDQLVHLNDVGLMTPQPTKRLDKYLKENAEEFIYPLYHGVPPIRQALDDLKTAPWISAKRWNYYKQMQSNFDTFPLTGDEPIGQIRNRANLNYQVEMFEAELLMMRAFHSG